MTNQPTWKIIANLGDADPVTYGGYFLMVDTTGVYAPEVELVEPPCDDVDLEDPDAVWTIYQFILEPHTYIDGILSDNPYHPKHAVWYADRLKDVADFEGTTTEALISALTGDPSDDPIAKAWAYNSIMMYFGAGEFDSYPLTLTYQEVTERTDKYLAELGA